jgi:very-short-patch-repair endonuclease
MRRRPTDAESALWKLLRNAGLLGAKFKRQQPIGEYIADFVCFESRVIVEVDGGQHTQAADGARTAWLQSQGFTVIRFWNNEVLTNIEGVYESISRALRDNPSPQPLSRKGRGAKARHDAGANNARQVDNAATSPKHDAVGHHTVVATRNGAKPLSLDGRGVGERVSPKPTARGDAATSPKHDAVGQHTVVATRNGAKPLSLDGRGVGERVSPKPTARDVVATSPKDDAVGQHTVVATRNGAKPLSLDGRGVGERVTPKPTAPGPANTPPKHRTIGR